MLNDDMTKLDYAEEIYDKIKDNISMSKDEFLFFAEIPHKKFLRAIHEGFKC